MNRPEAEKLLGGYAAGILTDSEKQALFAAALEHQELFDALMDEEALRELLADPGTRKRLLAVLPQPEEGKVQKVWRRPAFIGLAASLFALVTTSLMVWRFPPHWSLPVTPSEASAPPSVTEAAAQDKSESASSSFTLQKPASPLKAKSGGQSKHLEQVESGVSKAAPATMEASNRTTEDEERKDSEVVDASLSPVKAPELSQRAEPAGAMVAETRIAKKAKGSMQAGAGLSEKGLTPFASTLEHLPGGRARLKVTWDPRGYLYVMKRTPVNSTALSPRESISGKPGMRTTLFEVVLGEKDALDVYVLAEPVADPGSLPPGGAVQGEWRRVYPE